MDSCLYIFNTIYLKINVKCWNIQNLIGELELKSQVAKHNSSN